MTEFEKSRGISRRTVTRTAAWTVPAVAVVAASPAYAASGAGDWDAHVVAVCTPGLLSPQSAGFLVTNVGGPTSIMPTDTRFTLTVTGLANVSLLTGIQAVGLVAL